MKRTLPPGPLHPRPLPMLPLALLRSAPLVLPWLLLLVLALFLTVALKVAPLSPLAHDAGYSSLQAPWIHAWRLQPDDPAPGGWLLAERLPPQANPTP